MYATQDSISNDILFQGDIIADFPFFIFQNHQLVTKNRAGFFEPNSQELNGAENLHIIASKKMNIIILSQSCDIQRRANVIICPVYKLSDLVEQKAITTKQAESLKARRIYYYFYLPELNQFPESIADFQTMIYVKKEELVRYLGNRVMSLDSFGRHHLGWALANYFGRPVETP